MTNGKGYQTRQKSLLISCIRSMGDGHFTAQQILDRMRQNQCAVGLTTIYRQLDKMVESGEVRKYLHSTTSPACYEWIGEKGEKEECQHHYHLKCKECGRLYHVKCRQIDHFTSHILSEHGFTIDHSTTVFLGVCQQCRMRAE